MWGLWREERLQRKALGLVWTRHSEVTVAGLLHAGGLKQKQAVSGLGAKSSHAHSFCGPLWLLSHQSIN